MKMLHLLQFALACLVPSHVVALVGITNEPYDPVCAFACGNSLSSFMLQCSTVTDVMVGHSHGNAGMTSAECRANDTAYLTSLAWCMNIKCAPYNVSTWLLQKYWEEQSTMDHTVLPKWDYTTALHMVSNPPTATLNMDDTLNITVLAEQATWDTQYRTMYFLTGESKYESVYGIVLLVVGFATPIFLTCLGYLPYMTGILGRLKPFLVYPSIIGNYHMRPLPFLLGNAPTLGQSLYISLMVILNIVLSAVNYKSTAPSPHAWFPTQKTEIMGLVFYRTGVFALALAPLVLLFSSRNNVLLWVTNWSHSTFILLHRWNARIFAVHVVLHSLLAVVCYKESGIYATQSGEPYWQWGVVATVLVCIMLLASVLYFRRVSYEVFLIVHIILAAFVIAGSWYHVRLRFPDEWGYVMWLYAICAVWFFDRILRVLRILKNGIRRAKITEIGNGFVRVDIAGIRWTPRPSQHAYVHFPTLSKLRPWENHPFSVLATNLVFPFSKNPNHRVGDQASSSKPNNIEKHSQSIIETTGFLSSGITTGVTLFIRKSTGITKHLIAQKTLLTLLDGPYANNFPNPILQCDRVLLIGGGIGITGLLPWIPELTRPKVKLFWSVKNAADSLVQAFDDALSSLGEKDVRIGQRFDITTLISQEAQAGWSKIGVVICGPSGLCDDVRTAVVAIGKKEKVIFELEVDTYSW